MLHLIYIIPVLFLCIIRLDAKNVLFIAIDDLRPALGCYDDQLAITPNIDELAKTGTLFKRAYCQQALCSPSRLSLMTGLRPDSTKVWDLKKHFRDSVPDAVTLPQHFKSHGYTTQSIGKIFHGNGKPSKDEPSWSLPPLYDNARDKRLRYALGKNLQGNSHKEASTESAVINDDYYVDGKVCNNAIRAIEKFANSGENFFLAVGFRKPHLPFSAPKKYWDLYDERLIKLPENGSHPKGSPEIATRGWLELEGYSDIGKREPISDNKKRKLKHGYYACVSYIDTLIGKLLLTLKKSSLDQKTVVCLWGDHGFHLGEQGLWTKANNFELSTRVPLIISIPNQKKKNRKTDALVELIDIYPTLCSACDLPIPTKVEGKSLIPLINNPESKFKPAAYSQFPRHRDKNRHSGNGDIMGYSLRTETHRYTEWRENSGDKIISTELYDYLNDPLETQNIATLDESAEEINRLSKLLFSVWPKLKTKR